MVSIGVISKPHGIKGEVRVHPYVDCWNLFRTGISILIDNQGEENRVEIIQIRPHGEMLIVKISGVDDRNGAESLRGAEFLASEDVIPRREDGSFYAFQIIGLIVEREDGQYVGIVTDIMETPGQITYIVDAHGKEILIPAVSEFIKEINLDSGRIKIATIEGLID